MIQWCYEIWYDDNIIINDNIKNSFTKSGISFLMDGSKDDQFKFPDDEKISHGSNNKNKNLKLNNNNYIINEEEDKIENIQKKRKWSEESEGNFNNLITSINNIDIDNKNAIDKKADNNFLKDEEYENLVD